MSLVYHRPNSPKRKKYLKKRLHTIYIDKIDGKIQEKYYEEKFKEFSKEIELIDESLLAQTKAGIKTQSLGAKIYDTAQKGSGDYIKKDIETKRELIRLIFEKIEISGPLVNFYYSKEFTTLSELVDKTTVRNCQNLSKVETRFSNYTIYRKYPNIIRNQNLRVLFCCLARIRTSVFWFKARSPTIRRRGKVFTLCKSLQSIRKFFYLNLNFF